ncbi:MAG: hypothetical protein JW927_18980 [Deltaproteobacteria bacterium]|nr:hypothetical protein [Deltaproteobacteria bacterium]
MLALILVVIVTLFSTYVSCSINIGDITWLDYYQGIMAGFLASGIILQVSNKWRRVKELQKRSQSFMNNMKDWSDVILS